MAKNTEEAFRNSLIDILGRSLQQVLRSNPLMNRALIQSYREHIMDLRHSFIVVTFNLQAIEVARKDIIFVYIPPDLCPEYKVPRVSRNFILNNVTVISVCERTTQGLTRQGVPEKSILQLGLPVSGRLAQAANRRIELQTQEKGLGKALVHIGATGPEMPIALKVIERLVKGGIEVIVFCGDNPKISPVFREEVTKISDKITVYGGTSKQDRHTQLRLLLQVLEDPDVKIVVSRPNQWSLIALALGLEMIVMRGFQTFEEEAYRQIRRVNQNTVYADDFIRFSRSAIQRWISQGGLPLCTPDILRGLLNI